MDASWDMDTMYTHPLNWSIPIKHLYQPHPSDGGWETFQDFFGAEDQKW